MHAKFQVLGFQNKRFMSSFSRFRPFIFTWTFTSQFLASDSDEIQANIADFRAIN